MPKFICRLSGTEREPNGGLSTAEVSLCCLVRADTPELLESPLRELLLRLRAQGDVLADLNALFLDDILALSDQPGDAVLWYVAMRPGAEPGSYVTMHLPVPIDDSGRIESYGHGVDPVEHEGDEDVECEPFIRFDPQPAPRANKRPGKRKR